MMYIADHPLSKLEHAKDCELVLAGRPEDPHYDSCSCGVLDVLHLHADGCCVCEADVDPKDCRCIDDHEPHCQRRLALLGLGGPEKCCHGKWACSICDICTCEHTSARRRQKGACTCGTTVEQERAERMRQNSLGIVEVLVAQPGQNLLARGGVFVTDELFDAETVEISNTPLGVRYAIFGVVLVRGLPVLAGWKITCKTLDEARIELRLFCKKYSSCSRVDIVQVELT